MDRHDVLAAVGKLPATTMKQLFEAGAPLQPGEMRPGVWLGRNAGMSRPIKWAVRRIVRRDYFAKLLLDDGAGINIRVRQDGSYTFRKSRGRLVVDLPFAVNDRGLDYGFHVLGRNVRGLLQIRDFVRATSFERVRDVLGDRELADVDVRRGDACEEGTLVIGLIAPLGAMVLAGTPFGMVWDREATTDEIADARAYLQRPRVWDTTPVRP